MQLLSHFSRFPWRVPLYSPPIALAGGATEISYLFSSIGGGVAALLLLLGFLLIVGLVGYVLGIISLRRNDDVSGIELFFYVLLSIVHLLGTGFYWFICGAMLS